MQTYVPFWAYLTHFFLEWEMFQTEVVEKHETHILCSITFFFENTVYEIKWKHIVECGWPPMTIWCMCITCCIPKATNTHTGCAILIAFPQEQWLHERASMLHYTYNTLPVLLVICHHSTGNFAFIQENDLMQVTLRCVLYRQTFV
jgi:hypothetical protein